LNFSDDNVNYKNNNYLTNSNNHHLLQIKLSTLETKHNNLFSNLYPGKSSNKNEKTEKFV
jgi:hypothetical protein